jgi:TrmH family RNA methyltransferase
VPSDLLSRVVIVLDHPKDVVNIAGVIRVMMNFGMGTLRLVNPDDFDTYRVEGIAHRSTPWIEATTVHTSLQEAVADCSFVVGTTARRRTEGRNYTRPREVAPHVLEHAATGKVAILFGREDRGLQNEGLDLCHSVTIVPTSPEYSSLNLAQACLVMVYETFLEATKEGVHELPRGRRATRQPTQEELEQAFGALEDGLGRIEFFKARKPSAVMRTLRTIVTRADPDLRETRLLGAIGYEIGHYLRRTLPAEREAVAKEADRGDEEEDETAP